MIKNIYVKNPPNLSLNKLKPKPKEDVTETVGFYTNQ